MSPLSRPRGENNCSLNLQWICSTTTDTTLGYLQPVQPEPSQNTPAEQSLLLPPSPSCRNTLNYGYIRAIRSATPPAHPDSHPVRLPFSPSAPVFRQYQPSTPSNIQLNLIFRGEKSQSLLRAFVEQTIDPSRGWRLCCGPGPPAVTALSLGRGGCGGVTAPLIPSSADVTE